MASGVTTVVDIQGVSEHGALWCEVLAGSGMRAYVAPSFQEAVWRVRDGRVLEHEWNAERGRRGFEQACATLDLVRRHPSGRLGGMVFPAQVDTVGEGLMREAKAEARHRGLVFQTHCAQSVPEFRTPWSIAPGSRRSGGWRISACWTPPPSSATPSTSRPPQRARLARPGGSGDPGRPPGVGRPLSRSRSRAGARPWRTSPATGTPGCALAMGNDTGPHNMLERDPLCVHTSARVRSHAPATLSMSDVFRAATTGGARRSAGARQFANRVPGRHRPGSRPGPGRTWCWSTSPTPRCARASTRCGRWCSPPPTGAVRDVYVDGRLVYADRRPTGFDAPAASAELTEALAMKIAEISALGRCAAHGRDRDHVVSGTRRAVARVTLGRRRTAATG